MTDARRRGLRAALGWCQLVAACALSVVALEIVGAPSPVLLGGLVGGVVYALGPGVGLGVPAPMFRLSQSVVGVTIGAVVDLDTLQAVGTDAGPILVVTLTTLVASVLCGLLFSALGRVSKVT